MAQPTGFFSSLRRLCGLCVFALIITEDVHRKDAETAQVTQRIRTLRYLSCRGGGGCESSCFEPVSEIISLIVPTLDSMLAVSTGMKMTLALLLLVMSRKLSM